MNKSKHINIRVNPELEIKIKSIQKEMNKVIKINLNRSQVITLLIEKGIQKYVDERIAVNQN